MRQPVLHATACKGCRRRGRKCDRTLPTCLSCQRRGVACEGYVTRWPGVAARGKLAGKSIPVSDDLAATSTKPKPTINRTQSASAADIHTIGPGTARSLATPISDGDSSLDVLIQHYIDHLSNIFYLGRGLSHNPMFDHVLPLVDSVASVRYAIAASAACHTAARTSDSALGHKSLSLRVQATQCLSERLRDPNLATDQATLASILMLAQLDMCSGDCIEFETHLKAAIALVLDQDVDPSANQYFFEQRLAWLDILSSTTSTMLPNFTVEQLKVALGRFSSNGQREWSYDVFPCPIDLCEMLLDITMLYKTQLDRLSPSRETAEQAKCLMNLLENWKYSHDRLGPREHMIEAWRFGIMLYLRRLFPSVALSPNVAALTSRVLNHAGLIPRGTSWSYASLWPVFQAGVCLDERASDEKAWIRRHLEFALGAVGCRHFSNALETLEFVWHSNVENPSCFGNTFGRTIILG